MKIGGGGGVRRERARKIIVLNILFILRAQWHK